MNRYYTLSKEQRLFLMIQCITTPHELNPPSNRRYYHGEITTKANELQSNLADANIVTFDMTSEQTFPSLKSSGKYSVAFSSSERKRTVLYDIDVICSWPDRGCLIFFTYTLKDGTSMRRLLVSDRHSSEEILNYGPQKTCAPIEDLQMFAISDTLNIPTNDDDTVDLITSLFGLTFKEIYLKVISSSDHLSLCINSSQIDQTAASPPPTKGYKYDPTNLVTVDLKYFQSTVTEITTLPSQTQLSRAGPVSSVLGLNPLPENPFKEATQHYE